MPDALDLVEIRCRSGAQPVNERLEGSSTRTIVCLEFTKLRLGTSQHELGERRGVGTEPRAKGLQRGSQSRGLGDRMSRMGRRHADECSTVQHLSKARQSGVVSVTNSAGQVLEVVARAEARADVVEGAYATEV